MHGLEQTLKFFLIISGELIALFIGISILVGLLREYVPAAKIQRVLGQGKRGSVVGAGFGALTPFCSCSTIPLMVGLLNAGAAFGPTMSFLLASPLINPVVVGLFLIAFGWKITLVYFLFAFSLAVILGQMSEWGGLESSVRAVRIAGGENDTPQGGPFKARLKRASWSAWQEFLGFVPYMLIGVAIGAAIHGFMPQNWVARAAGPDNPLAVPVAAVVGVPLYIRASTMVPIGLALIGKGMSLGAVMALIIGGAGASIPEISLLAKIFKPRLLFAFVLAIFLTATLVGFLFNAFLL